MDELTEMLLNCVTEGHTPDLSLPDMVERLLGDDPMAAPLAAALRQREATAGTADDNFEDTMLDAELSDLLERLDAELEHLRTRNHRLADALGACPRCWGENELCPICHGRGRPRGRPPDAGLFLDVVEPAWRRRFGSFDDDSLFIPAGEVLEP